MISPSSELPCNGVYIPVNRLCYWVKWKKYICCFICFMRLTHAINNIYKLIIVLQLYSLKVLQGALLTYACIRPDVYPFLYCAGHKLTLGKYSPANIRQPLWTTGSIWFLHLAIYIDQHYWIHTSLFWSRLTDAQQAPYPSYSLSKSADCACYSRIYISKVVSLLCFATPFATI